MAAAAQAVAEWEEGGLVVAAKAKVGEGLVRDETGEVATAVEA